MMQPIDNVNTADIRALIAGETSYVRWPTRESWPEITRDEVMEVVSAHGIYLPRDPQSIPISTLDQIITLLVNKRIS